jgi:hypothetical protein
MIKIILDKGRDLSGLLKATTEEADPSLLEILLWMGI